MQDFAAELGISRQAVDQALARSEERPKPIAKLGPSNIYNRAELREWWDKRAELTRSESRRKFAQAATIQINVRLTAHAAEMLDKARFDGEMRSSAARRILTKALTGGDGLLRS